MLRSRAREGASLSTSGAPEVVAQRLGRIGPSTTLGDPCLREPQWETKERRPNKHYVTFLTSPCQTTATRAVVGMFHSEQDMTRASLANVYMYIYIITLGSLFWLSYLFTLS